MGSCDTETPDIPSIQICTEAKPNGFASVHIDQGLV